MVAGNGIVVTGDTRGLGFDLDGGISLLPPPDVWKVCWSATAVWCSTLGQSALAAWVEIVICSWIQAWAGILISAGMWSASSL